MTEQAPNKDHDENPVIRFSNGSDCLPQLRALTESGIRSIDIFSHYLNPIIFADEAFIDAVISLIHYSPRSTVRILIRHTQMLHSSTANSLLALTQRIPSKVKVRRYMEGAKDPDMGFVCVDQKHLLYFNDESSFIGFSRRNAKAESRNVLDEFEHLWIYGSEEDPDLRALCI